MKSRRLARRLALDALYEAEIRGATQGEPWSAPTPGLSEDDAPGAIGSPPPDDAVEYARRLIRGIGDHREEIDALIGRYADRWALDRMPVVDRILLRIAVLELLWEPDVPVAVAINEAVELAKSYSTEDSGRFVNGVLGKLAEQESTRST